MNRIERIKLLIEHQKLTQTEFSSMVGVQKQVVSNWLNYVQNMPDKYLVKMVEQFKDIDARWLITGEGSIDGRIVRSEEERNQYQEPLEKIIAMKDAIIEEKERTIKSKDELIKLLLEKK